MTSDVILVNPWPGRVLVPHVGPSPARSSAETAQDSVPHGLSFQFFFFPKNIFQASPPSNLRGVAVTCFHSVHVLVVFQLWTISEKSTTSSRRAYAFVTPSTHWLLP